MTRRSLALFVLLCSGMFAACAPALAQGAPSSTITAIDTRTGTVSAKVNASGVVFQFKLTNPAGLSTLRVGQGVYANLTTHQVSLDGRSVAGPITAMLPAPAAAAPAAAAPEARPPADPCCSITAIDPVGMVTARVTASGEVFQFRASAGVRPSVGQGVYANFGTKEVSLDGKTMGGTITAMPAAAAATPPAAQAPQARPAIAAPNPAPGGAASERAVTPGAAAARTPAAPAAAAMRPLMTQLPVMSIAAGTIQQANSAPAAAAPAARPRFEARTLSASVNGTPMNAHVVHVRGLDGIEQAQGLPDGVKELLMMHVKTLAPGESDDYIINTDLATQWAKTHPVSAAVKKTAQDTDSHTGCKSFSMHCAGEATEHAEGQASDVLKQAKDDWNHSATQLGHDWDVSADQIEACFADHVTNPADIPVQFALQLPSLLTLNKSDIETIIKAIKATGELGQGQSVENVIQQNSDLKPQIPKPISGQIVFGIPYLSSNKTVVHADFSYIPCMAFLLRPHSVGVTGTLNVETSITGNLQLTGQYDGTIPLPKQDIHIPIQALPIVIPPAGPPVLEMDLSVFVQGYLQLTAKGTVSTSFNLDYAHTTGFDFTCDGKGCKQISMPSSQVSKAPMPPETPNTTASEVSGGVQIQPKLFTGIELNIDYDALQMRVGPEAVLEADLQGCASLATSGMTGTTSDALLAELGWTPGIRADVLSFSQQIGDGYNQPLEHEQILGFTDLLSGLGGSKALTPAVAPAASGKTPLGPGESAIYNIKMPSCYPYPDPVIYRVSWTGGALTAGTKGCAAPTSKSAPAPSELICQSNPKQPLALGLAWPQGSTTDYTITVEAVGDSLGRKFTSKPAVVPVSVAAK